MGHLPRRYPLTRIGAISAVPALAAMADKGLLIQVLLVTKLDGIAQYGCFENSTWWHRYHQHHHVGNSNPPLLLFDVAVISKRRQQ
jgi:hypothetical protein